IKSAHIGIAMGSGTDVAKETADMIIADDNFSSIVQGVKEGRTAYSNIRKVTYLLLSQGIGEILFFFTSILCGLPLPLVATQILYLNVITNGLQDLALNFEKTESGVLKEKPRPTKESLFSKSLILECLISGFVIGAVVFGVWYTLMKSGTDLVFARSIVMALMVFIQNFHTFNCRSETKSIFQMPLKSNWFVWCTVVLAFVLQVVIMEVPFLAHLISLTTVPALDLLYLFILSSVILIVMEAYKLFVRRYRKKRNITTSY
ncbi:MAG: cation transporting ATPase C-terminal domain-containing protein, partial [Clostridia bacterium]|nr:cation transporting ATPase C-terminal domain-containing protein [Clostridia bacterium]